MKTVKAVIHQVTPGSLAAKAGLAAGDAILSINGQSPVDLIDLSFAFADEKLSLEVEKISGEVVTVKISKRYHEDLGIEFASAVFEGIRPCANRCIFCFVDQMPAGMRESLYVKDDDYRMSFLYGNFITLTNLGPADYRRIRQLHLSPLYVSVHATDATVRANMLGRKEADVMEPLARLREAGVEVHTQVVLCPEHNDGAVLAKTVTDLMALQEQVLSLAIVPVGLTRYRETCAPLRCFTVDEALTVVQQVRGWQQECLEKFGRRFVFLSDEFYLQAGVPLPTEEEYEDFPQLENGVGLVADFRAEWAATEASTEAGGLPGPVIVATGLSATPILQQLISELPDCEQISVLPIPNRFFGEQITVTGLLTGGDLAAALALPARSARGIIIPGVALRKGEQLFLDGMALDELEQQLGVPLRVAHNGGELKRILCHWR